MAVISAFPFTTNAGTYLDLQKALLFKQHGQYAKAYPILLQLAEDEFVRAQMELADMYVNGYGVMKNNDEAIYWACRAAKIFGGDRGRSLMVWPMAFSTALATAAGPDTSGGSPTPRTP